MPELVAHKIEVAVPGGADGDQTDQLMESDSPIHYRILRVHIHREIHLLVEQSEYQGFVTDKRLVVALRVADGLLVRPLVGQLVPDLTRTPFLILLFLYPFDPVVGHAHRHPEPEAHSASLERSRQARHSAHILSDSDGLRLDLTDQQVRQSQIGHSVLIDSCVEIRFIAVEVLPKTVIPVNHTRHTVETETVKMIFLKPVLAVAQEEAHDLVLAVIEAAGAPGRVMPLRTFVEIQILAAVKQAKALILIAATMRVNYVHHDSDTHPVRRVHQFLELLRSAETGTQGEKVRHLIAERPVIRMLLKGHYLDCIIAQPFHPRQHILTELTERGDLTFLRTHPDVALVDERMRPAQHPVVLPRICLRGIPDLGAEHLRLVILHKPRAIGRNPLATSAGPLDEQFVQLSVTEEHRIKPKFPVAVPGRLELVR